MRLGSRAGSSSETSSSVGDAAIKPSMTTCSDHVPRCFTRTHRATECRHVPGSLKLLGRRRQKSFPKGTARIMDENANRPETLAHSIRRRDRLGWMTHVSDAARRARPSRGNLVRKSLWPEPNPALVLLTGFRRLWVWPPTERKTPSQGETSSRWQIALPARHSPPGGPVVMFKPHILHLCDGPNPSMR